MTKQFKVSLLFVLIFLVGVLGFVTYINRSLNENQFMNPVGPSEEIIEEYSHMR